MQDAQKHILLVDDDSYIREMVSEHLQRQGYCVDAASSGPEALTLAAKVPDLILLDLGLPGMTGLEVVKKLKENEATSHIPFIVFSNSAEAEDHKNAVELGAAGFMIKAQSTPEEILACLATYFSHHTPVA